MLNGSICPIMEVNWEVNIFILCFIGPSDQFVSLIIIWIFIFWVNCSFKSVWHVKPLEPKFWRI